MHPDLHAVAEFFGHVARHYDQCRAQSAPSSPLDGVPNQLALILKELKQMSETFNDEMAALRADVTAQSTVIASATAAFKGLVDKLAAAEQSAIDKGATPDQTADMAALRVSLEANTAALSAAIQQNTTAAVSPAPEPPAPVTIEQPAVTEPTAPSA